MDTDADKMMRAAHVLAGDLAGSLAVSTVLELLQQRTLQKLQELIKANPTVLTTLPVDLAKLEDGCVMKLISGVVSENMQLGSLIVEKAAMDAMQREITEALAGAAMERRRAAEARAPLLVPQNGRWPTRCPRSCGSARRGSPRSRCARLKPASARAARARRRRSTRRRRRTTCRRRPRAACPRTRC